MQAHFIWRQSGAVTQDVSLVFEEAAVAESLQGRSFVVSHEICITSAMNQH